MNVYTYHEVFQTLLDPSIYDCTVHHRMVKLKILFRHENKELEELFVHNLQYFSRGYATSFGHYASK